MAAPLNITRNNYRREPKDSSIYTPAPIAEFLYFLLCDFPCDVLLDPAIGRGALTIPWAEQHNPPHLIGVDIDPEGCGFADDFLLGRFEDITDWTLPLPDLVMCNPPYNGGGRRLYAEIFLEQIVRLFGADQPTVLFAPMGCRLNQRWRSSRWKWIRDKLYIGSIISLPLNAFANVEVHSEILIFNITGLRPHYFLPFTIDHGMV